MHVIPSFDINTRIYSSDVHSGTVDLAGQAGS